MSCSVLFIIEQAGGLELAGRDVERNGCEEGLCEATGPISLSYLNSPSSQSTPGSTPSPQTERDLSQRTHVSI